MQAYGRSRGNCLDLGTRLLSYSLRRAICCRRVPRPPKVRAISRRLKYPTIRMGRRLIE
jgi:hypothetical protein